MIKKIHIRNFKSIKDLRFTCNKINVFIGEPNTGKSNLLESIGIFSSPFLGYGSGNLSNFTRLDTINNLFYDEVLQNTINVAIDNIRFRLEPINSGRFKGKLYSADLYKSDSRKITKLRVIGDFSYNNIGKYIDGNPLIDSTDFNKYNRIRSYRYKSMKSFPNDSQEYLNPPNGDNLLGVLKKYKDIRDFTKDIFKKYGLKLVIRPQNNTIELQKEIDESIFISFPFHLISDTLQRIIFYMAVIESNKNASIILEEPESNSFPFYTQFLAERIAMDEKRNQYFISTHNPYFLTSILSKGDIEKISVFLTYYEDYKTRIKRLSKVKINEILNHEIDAFLNTDWLM